MQRYIFAGVLLCMIVIVVFVSFFFTSIVPLGSLFGAATIAATPTPLPTPSPIPTPSPTPMPSPTPTPLVGGLSAYMVDGNTGKVLFDMNSHMRLPMASTTKIMTAVLAIENLNLDQSITIQQDEIDEVPPGMSVAQLQAGDRIHVRDLLYGLLLPSGSDVAVVFAHTIAGTTPNFVAMMNNKARLLGLNDTHYSNPHGFADPNHYTSAADLTTLARYAMRFAIFDQIVAQQNYVLPATLHNHLYNTWNNTNGLLGTYPGANGVKTGSSDDAGYCMVFSATHNGRFLIGTEMHADSFDQLFNDAQTLLDKGFAHP